MSGNVALDVAIGLIFIYLIYSLYATVVMEIVSSLFGLRARNLCYTLKRMLMEEKDFKDSPATKFGARILTTFTRVTGYAVNLKEKELYKEFFSQPSIKYLASGGSGNRPSYLAAENFSKALIDTIKVDSPEASVMACLEEGLLTKFENNIETKRQIQSLLNDANYDLVKFKILLENWYNDTMERSSGWFKQTTQGILAVIGLVIVVSFNVDTIAIVKKLAKDDKARSEMVQMAISFSERNQADLKALKDAKDKSTDTTTAALVTNVNAKVDTLLATQRLLQEEIRNSQSVMGNDWHIPDSAAYTFNAKKVGKDTTEIIYQIGQKTACFYVHKSVDKDLFLQNLQCKEKLQVAAKGDSDGFLKVNTVRYKYGYVFSWEHIWGYLLTILALSMGAPFWFDLLNKLIKLRTSRAIATDSEEKKGPSSAVVTNRGILNRVG